MKPRQILPLFLMSLVCSVAVHAACKEIVKGWLKVSIDEQAILTADNEFLGTLIEQGLDISNTTWIKPAFGNDNMLWFVDRAGAGHRYYQRLRAMDTKQFPNTRAQSGDKTPWQYAGYDYTDTPFVLRLYRCAQKENGTMLLFWSGDRTPKYHDLDQQLEYLQGACAAP